ncbi:uncharacterized protein ColSpa_01074 [Colletotrichum spaethianum]|uniref:Uncharacterized protein n=1 Tax=Colletotrichum spaethianum TaxID=700344 RepID=A0AA37L759_9PEZI|nr:uncharacterized protein ColSpa_01074 [Colletotrichum spaethianum]GKT40893.1 hypothetical protein ColSpa_01074 [Colletotrichum spaethianum]
MTMKRRDPRRIFNTNAVCGQRLLLRDQDYHPSIRFEAASRLASTSPCNAEQDYARPATISNTRIYPYPINIAVQNEG